MNRRAIVILLCILVVALGLRLFQLTRISGQPLAGDSIGYDNIAWNVAEGNGYKFGEGPGSHYTAIRGPSYILFLASIYYLTDHSIVAAQAIQVLLDVVTCFVLFRIALSLFKRRDIALVSALLYAIYPPAWKQAAWIITEPFVNLMFILTIYGVISFFVDGKKSGVLICAIALAVGSLSKPVMLVLPVIAALSSWKTMKTRKQELLLPIVCVAVVTIFFAPWWVRNERVYHRFVPTLTSGGVAFWGGTGPNNGTPVGGLYGDDVPPQVKKAFAALDEYHLDKWLYQEGIRVIKSDPPRYTKLLVKKAINLWFWPMYQDKNNHRFTACFTLLLMALAVYAIVAARPIALSIRILLLLIICYTGVHLVYFADPRYVMPILAYMFVFSATGIVSICERGRSRLRVQG